MKWRLDTLHPFCSPTYFYPDIPKVDDGLLQIQHWSSPFINDGG